MQIIMLIAFGYFLVAGNQFMAISCLNFAFFFSMIDKLSSLKESVAKMMKDAL